MGERWSHRKVELNAAPKIHLQGRDRVFRGSSRRLIDRPTLLKRINRQAVDPNAI
jgi:hypothetical protein